MFKSPSVSVIVPVYNTERFVDQCVRSLLIQKLKEIEIILVDNGSTDSCPRILNNYAKENPNIRVIHINKNESLGIAYNQGIKAAQGEYVGFVDSDDWVSPEMYDDLYRIALRENVDVVKSFFFMATDSGIRINKTAFGKESLNKRITDKKQAAKFVYGHMSIWSSIYRRSFLNNNNICFTTTPGASFQDMFFGWCVYTKLASLYVVSNAYYYYRISSSQAINQGYTCARWILDVHKRIQNQINEENLDASTLEIYLRFFYISLKNSWEREDRLAGFRRLVFAKAVSKLIRNYREIANFSEFSTNEKKYFLRIVDHPFWSTIKKWFARSKSHTTLPR